MLRFRYCPMLATDLKQRIANTARQWFCLPCTLLADLWHVLFYQVLIERDTFMKHELLFSNDAFYLCHHGELHRNPLFAWCGTSKWAGQRLWRKQNTSLQNDSHSCCFQDDDLCVLIVGCMLLASPFPSHTRGKESMPHISVYHLKCRYKLPCIIHSIGAHSGNA